MSNPLISAYRKPSLYIDLPSGGKYYDPAPKLSVDGELAVYAMTARDELITKTPDALFNGEASVSLIQSCCPDIPNPSQIPVNDLMVIMLGIRQASYGSEIEVEVPCEKCEHVNNVAVNCQSIIDGAMSRPRPENVVTINDGFEVTLKPYSLEDRNTIQIQQIKQVKMIEGLQNTQVDDQSRQKLFGQTFVEMAELTVDLVTNCVDSVRTPSSENETVSDKDMIREWLKNITSKDYEVIKTKVDELSNDGVNNNFNVTCESCQHTWQTEVELDITNFFAG
tara:strand:+ start:1176 stop:2015 length:840 start_codon:yes stop_codon:yes gene_type:complete